ncbi:TolC family outer membrane protein [Paraburkholderia humisilvae]|uniref:Outer membrane protein TolC n=1 Tax=Paraburkholderia humisilvae TaxID=627669 RepID=A0A6J5F6J9_9BURK|nr:TolC family outer membrane protein [Paraburkholderia humisilvae]CAB3774498.1 Outer membrane protein TolC [Paraburkholderia humisilvae]
MFNSEIWPHRVCRQVPTAALVLALLTPLARAEDLIQIYQFARQADPTLAASDATRKATHENVDMARSALLPQVNANYTYGRQFISAQTTALTQDYQGNYITPSSTYTEGKSSAPGISMDVMLFSWANIMRLRSAKASADGADYVFDGDSQDLIVRTAEAYFDVLSTKEQLNFAKANQKFLGQQLNEIKALYQAGERIITDVNQTQAQYDTSVAQVVAAQNEVDSARERLIQIIGREFGTLKTLREQVPLNKPDPADEQAWVELSYKQNPQLAASKKTVEAADYSVGTARAGHLPTLSGSFQRTITKAWGTETGQIIAPGFNYSTTRTGSTTIGLTLSIPLFSGGYASAQTRQAIFQRDAAQDQLEGTRRRVAAGTRNAYRAVISGIKQIEATRAALVSAQSAVDAAQASYKAGSKTLLDMLTSQTNLLNAQVSYSQARHQFVLDSLVLRQMVGAITPADLETINALLQ